MPVSNRDDLSLQHVSGLLGLPGIQVVRLAREGGIPAEREGEIWRFPRQAVQQWIAGNRGHTRADGQPVDSDAPPAFNIVDSEDLDHYRAQPGNWNVQVNQLSKGSFRSCIRSLSLPGMVVYDNRWGCASLVRGQSPEGWLMMGGVVAPEQGTLHWCGHRADRQLFACTSERKAISFSVEDKAHDVVLLIAPELLRQTAGSEALDLMRHAQYLDFGVAGAQLVDLSLSLIRQCESHALLLQQPAIASRVRSALLRVVEECFSAIFTHGHSGDSPDSRELAVHKAVEHVWQASGPVSAWSMAQAAGVSQKTLELAFRQAMGMTPGKYLMLTRLNGAHHELADAIRGQHTVTEVALRWGFSHIGRFSGAYRQLFGELPSQTLGQPCPRG